MSESESLRRPNAVFSVIIRVLVVGVCAFATVESIRWAVVDWLISTGQPAAFDRAIRLDPDNELAVAHAAIFRSNTGDTSPAVDQQLKRAAALNPRDSEVLIALGLHEELQGNDAQAEGDLLKAAAIDRQFKPAWTLANYYYRANQPDKFWPMIERCLKLEPLGFDPAPVFDLAWNETSDSKKILSLVPTSGPRPVQYLNYLIKTDRVDAAFEVWPEVLAAAKASGPSGAGSLAGFPDFLEQKGRIPEAVQAWNQLVDGGIIPSGRLDPQHGVSIANPEFRFPLLDRAFGWRAVTSGGGVSAGISSGSLRFEFDGNEPESLRLLDTVAPVLAGRHYRLVWASDGGDLSSAKDAGLIFHVIQQPGDTATQCPLLSAGATCTFDVSPRTRDVRIELDYARALGTTRIQGVLRISSVRLEMAS